MTQISLTHIKRRYVLEARPLDAAMEAALRADSRAGARAILQAIERRRFENRAEGQRLRRLMRYEWSLWDKGVLQVAGVDEAGMKSTGWTSLSCGCDFPSRFSYSRCR